MTVSGQGQSLRKETETGRWTGRGSVEGKTGCPSERRGRGVGVGVVGGVHRDCDVQRPSLYVRDFNTSFRDPLHRLNPNVSIKYFSYPTLETKDSKSGPERGNVVI